MNNCILYINGRQNPHERLAEMRAARALGLSIILMAKQIPAYAAELADETALVDLDDFAACLTVARSLHQKYAFSGIVCWSETDVPLKNFLARELHLAAMSEQAVRHSRDKIAMKQRLQHLGPMIPAFQQVSSLKDAQQAAKQWGYPVIVKPASGSGSKGIFKVSDEGELAQALAQLANIATDTFDTVFSAFGGQIILEEFVDGPEFSVDGYVADEQITVIGITDYQSDPVTFVENRHIFPSHHSDGIQEEIKQCARNIVRELGINHTVFHLEGKYSSKGFKFIECAARPAGGYISTHLLQYASRYQHLQNYVQLCRGLPPVDLQLSGDFIGVRYLFAEKAGTLQSVDNVARVLNHPAIQHLYLHFAPGHAVTLPPEDYSAYRLGVLIATGESYQQLADTLEWAAEQIRFTIQ
ncbi:ATP-grasp domain-containing protein [Serratia marcescens]|uniref:ATP-grasp domain-containing protein n=1 Tax=Serratia marcescens TaxID=615 RepID=UPI0011E67A22|nr:ATP-grasp domain-containing protein [Serratia marcescens]